MANPESSPSSNELEETSASLLTKKEKKRLKKERKEKKKQKKAVSTRQEGGEPTAEETKPPVDSDDDKQEKKRLKKERKHKSKKHKKETKKQRKESIDSSESDSNNKRKRKSKQRKQEKKKPKESVDSSDSDSDNDNEHKSDKEEEPSPKKQRIIQEEEEPLPDHGDPRIVESSALESEPDRSKAGPVTLVLFYQYVEPIWTLEKYQQVLKDMDKLGKKLGLTGRMRIAREGLNCTLTASRSKIVEFCQTLRKLPEFKTTEFKLTNDLPEPQRFPQFKVIEVIELVHYGLEGEKAPPIQDFKGVHLEPQDYHKKIAEKDSVMIDVRNHYEAIIGHFQPPNKDAWLDPNMRKSTEFPVWLDKPETKEKLKGKQVLMYV